MTNILANHECAKHELFQKMHDGINGGSSVKSGEGAWAYVSTAIAEALGHNANSVYNQLYPETPDNKKHQLFQQALSQADKELKEKPEEGKVWLATTIMSAYHTLCKENGISLKSQPAEGGSEKAPRSRTFTWTYSAEQTEAFPKQADLDKLQHLKSAMEENGMEMPAEKASELDKLEKEAKNWETTHNAEAKVKQAESANYGEYMEQASKFLLSLASSAKKVSMLAEAGKMGLDICSGLANGSEKDKEDYAKLKEFAGAMLVINSTLSQYNVK